MNKQYQRSRVMELMALIEDKHNNQHLSIHAKTFEGLFPELTNAIWEALDNNKPLSVLIERLNKLVDGL